MINRLGFDKAIIYSASAKGWQAAAGLISIVAVISNLTAEAQGYYYTFAGLIALQIFVELGLSFVVVQFASHEASRLLRTSDRKSLELGDEKSKKRLSSLLIFILTWFGIASICLVPLLFITGSFFLKDINQVDLDRVLFKWFLLVIFASLNLFVTSITSFLEGCGWIEDMSKMRLIQSISSSLALWTVLFLGGDLFSLAASSFVTLLIGVIWISYHYRHFLIGLIHFKSCLPGINWKEEILPFQLKIAASWISGYLTFQIISPVILKFQGPIAAGQMGISLQILSAMGGIAMTWITTKLPRFGGLISLGKREELDKDFRIAAIQSVSVLTIGLMLVIAIGGLLLEIYPAYISRFLDIRLFVVLSVATLCNHISGILGAYIRAHKQDSLVWLSLFSGVTTATLTIVMAKYSSIAAVVFSYMSVAIILNLAGAVRLYKLFRLNYA